MNYTVRALMAAGLMLAAVTASAQDLIPTENSKGKWGYVDPDGREVIPCKYDAAEPFADGLAKVKKGDKYGFINSSNSAVVPIKYQAIEAFPFLDGIYKVAAGGKVKDGSLEGEKYGFIDNTGVEIIKPEFDEIGTFAMGLAHVKKGDKYGYINTDLRMVVPCEFAAIGRFNADSVVWVNQGGKFAKDKPQKIVGGKFGLYNKDGKVIIPVSYAEIGTMTPWHVSYSDADLKGKKFYDKKNLTEAGRPRWIVRTTFEPTMFSCIGQHQGFGYYMSTKPDGSKNGIITADGKIIIPANKYDRAYFPEEGYAPVSVKGKMNYLNINTGQMLLNSPVSMAYSFQNGHAVIANNNLYYLINLNGEKETTGYSYIYALKDGVYVVRSNDKYGLINSEGLVIIAPTYAAILPPSHGLLAVQPEANAKMGYINTAGKYVIEPVFTNACSFALGYASVQGPQGWGAITPTGESVVECRWNDIYQRSFENQRYVWVEDTDKLAHCYDTQTKALAFPKGYTSLRNFDLDFEGVAIVWQGKDKIGVVDTNGNELVPTEMPDVATACWAYGLIESGEIEAWRPVHTYRMKIKKDPNRHEGKLTNTINAKLWDF